MKAVYVIAAGLVLQSCIASHKPVQVSVVDAELVKIDTIYRQQKPIMLLTWRSSDQVEYYSFAHMAQKHRLGYKMPVLIRR